MLGEIIVDECATCEAVPCELVFTSCVTILSIAFLTNSYDALMRLGMAMPLPLLADEYEYECGNDQ